MNQEKVFVFHDGYELSREVAQAYLESLNTHIACVRQAGELVGGIPYKQLLIHDASKFSEFEFPHYARSFFGDKADPNGFAGAWLHHVHNNSHHWQHWIFPDGYTPKGSELEKGVVPMPEVYVREMVADWMGASYAYTKSWDMNDWLKKNLSKIRLHTKTKKYLSDVLLELGYESVLVYSGML